MSRVVLGGSGVPGSAGITEGHGGSGVPVVRRGPSGSAAALGPGVLELPVQRISQSTHVY